MANKYKHFSDEVLKKQILAAQKRIDKSETVIEQLIERMELSKMTEEYKERMKFTHCDGGGI